MIAALDFDGVIIDSAYECILTANTAYQLPVNGIIPDRLATPPDHIAEQFLTKRYMVSFAGEYWLLLYCLYEGIDISNVETFQFLSKRQPVRIEDFEEKFFAVRHHVIGVNPEYWLGLHGASMTSSPWVGRGMGPCRGHVYRVYEGNASIKNLLDHFGVDIEQDRIIGLATKLDRNLTDFALVDGHLPQLLSVAKLSVSTSYWTAWGYWNCDPAGVPQGIYICNNLSEIF